MDAAQRERAAANKAAALEKVAARKRRADAAAAADAADDATRAEKRRRGAAAGGCEACGGGPVVEELAAAFSVRVCADCRRNDDAYDLVNATDAARTYLLPQATLKMLPAVERTNPRRPTWRPMRLHLRRQLKEYADRRWGDAAGLEAERRQRDARHLAAADKKAEGFFRRPAADAE